MTVINPNEKRICIVGLGYVGTVTGVCFAELGNHVVFVDIDEKKIETINSGKSPIFEGGLNRLIKKNRDKIVATNNFAEAVQSSYVTFVCVGTPSKDDGSMNLDYVLSAVKSIGEILKEKEEFHVVVVKSTVIPSTTKNIILPLLEKHSGKEAGKDFGLAMNPEFLREGIAVKDFLEPDRIVIGSYGEKSNHVLKKLYKVFSCPIVETSLSAAEMTKYVSNAFLALKISFANEIGNTCKKLGIDTYEIFQAVGLDHRINPAFFRAGIGFGGSCFPKDISALISRSDEIGLNAQILKSVMQVNDEQPLKLIELLKKHITSLKDRKIGVLGLAFKPNTDDIRESRAIPIVKTLIEKGAKVIAYDPMAKDNFKKLYPQVEYVSSSEKVLDSDAVLIVTEWKEFENLDYTGKIVIDGRKIEKAKKEAAIYEGMCW